jgi:hypothetical protein
MLRSGEDANVLAESGRRELVFGYIMPSQRFEPLDEAR